MLNKKRKRSLQYKNESKVIDPVEAKKKRKEKRKAFAKEATGQDKNISAKRAKKRNKARMIYSAIIIGMIALIVVTAYSVISQKMEYDRISAEQQKLAEEKNRLEYELKQVDTLEYVEEQARSLLKMIKPGEILYVLPSKEIEDD